MVLVRHHVVTSPFLRPILFHPSASHQTLHHPPTQSERQLNLTSLANPPNSQPLLATSSSQETLYCTDHLHNSKLSNVRHRTTHAQCLPQPSFPHEKQSRVHLPSRVPLVQSEKVKTSIQLGRYSPNAHFSRPGSCSLFRDIKFNSLSHVTHPPILNPLELFIQPRSPLSFSSRFSTRYPQCPSPDSIPNAQLPLSSPYPLRLYPVLNSEYLAPVLNPCLPLPTSEPMTHSRTQDTKILTPHNLFFMELFPYDLVPSSPHPTCTPSYTSRTTVHLPIRSCRLTSSVMPNILRRDSTNLIHCTPPRIPIQIVSSSILFCWR